MITTSLRTATVLLAAIVPATAFAEDGPGPDWAETYFQDGGNGMPACGVCHTMEAAGSSGQVGPSLDQLKPDIDQVRAAVRDGVGVMPAFADALSDTEIDAMSAYVANSVK